MSVSEPRWFTDWWIWGILTLGIISIMGCLISGGIIFHSFQSIGINITLMSIIGMFPLSIPRFI